MAFVLLVILACFCCLMVFGARRRRQRKRALFEAEDNLGYGGRRYYAPASTSQPGLSRGAVARNAPSEFSDESSDNFYFYQNVRGRPFGGAGASAAPARQLYDFEEDDTDSIDSRFSGIIKNMWNMVRKCFDY